MITWLGTFGEWRQRLSSRAINMAGSAAAILVLAGYFLGEAPMTVLGRVGLPSDVTEEINQFLAWPSIFIVGILLMAILVGGTIHTNYFSTEKQREAHEEGGFPAYRKEAKRQFVWEMRNWSLTWIVAAVFIQLGYLTDGWFLIALAALVAIRTVAQALAVKRSPSSPHHLPLRRGELPGLIPTLIFCNVVSAFVTAAWLPTWIIGRVLAPFSEEPEEPDSEQLRTTIPAAAV